MKDTIKQSEEKMNKSIDVLGQNLKSIRAGRANPAILDKVTVDYYGAPTKIDQMAAIAIPEARTLVIQPWDATSLGDIEKAILASDIGITPNNDGKVIRLNFPQLTEERRRDIVKDVHKFGEDGKVAVRAIRRDANEKLKALKKSSTITEDDLKDGENQVQKLTDKFCKDVDQIIKDKENEIMEI